MGLFRICQKFLEIMVPRHYGSIINISSIYGVVSNNPTIYSDTEMVQAPSYNFVKAGMLNYTATWLATTAGMASANAISPGGYFNSQPAPFVAQYERRLPLGRMMNNDDIQAAPSSSWPPTRRST